MSETPIPTQPETITLTADYLDFATGVVYEKGTILERQASGQYAPKGTKLGEGGCIAHLGLLESIYEEKPKGEGQGQ